LRAASNVAILTHAKPDGDALGSTLALARTLTRIDIRATPVYVSPFPQRLKPLVGDTSVIYEQPGTWTSQPLTEFDTACVLDTGSWKQVSGATTWLSSRADSTIIIDHHAHGDPDMAAARYIDPKAAAAAQIVADLCIMLLDVDSARHLPAQIAEALYLGITTDTGWFRYSNTTPDAMRLAADLVDAGADQQRIYRIIEQSDSPNRLRLIQRALNSLQLLAHDTIAVMTITRTDINDCSASNDELGGLSDLPQSVATVRAVAVITELEPNLTKVSLRSKPDNAVHTHIDVNQVAQSLGGGGHVHAAGARLDLPLTAAKKRIIDALTRAASV